MADIEIAVSIVCKSTVKELVNDLGLLKILAKSRERQFDGSMDFLFVGKREAGDFPWT
jgi:hypothetical protein